MASALALVASLVAMVGVAAPASAATPTISISPTSITDGGQVTIDLEGFDASQTLVAALCPATVTDPAAQCNPLQLAQGSSSLQTTVAVHDENSGLGVAPFTCSTTPGGCVIAGFNAVLATPITTSNFVSTPITITVPWTISAAASSANNGDSVTVTTAGFPAGQPGAIGECPASVTAATVSNCLTLASYPDGIPASAQVVVHDQYQNGTWTDCSAPFGNCALAAWSPDPNPTAFAKTPFNINGPTLLATPNPAIDGQTVTVSSSNGLVAPGPATIWECPNSEPVTSTYTLCTAPQDFTVDASGSFSIPFVFHDPFPGADGTTRTCADGCYLTVITSNGNYPYTTSISSATPTIRPLATAFNDGRSITAQLQNFPNGPATVAECAAAGVGTDLASSNCTNPQPTTVTGGSSTLLYVMHAWFTGASGPVDCMASSCVLVGFSATGAVVAKSLPLTFTTLLSLTPNTRLHDGDPISVTARGLSPNSSYRLAHCVPGTGSVAGSCESLFPATVTSDANGNISANLPALQRFTSGGFFSLKTCITSPCSIAVIDSSGSVVAEQPYTLATPTVSASPATGLADGQTITVSGSDLEPTYSAPTLLPTGGWAVFECDKAVGSNPSLLAVFTNCVIPPGGGAVNVPATTSSSSVQVQATLSEFLGGTTDCTATPGACVVGLMRFEQDATITAAFTPITFG